MFYVNSSEKTPKNLNINEVCRVCSSRASYDLFQQIPAYLHETDKEHLNWRQPVGYYLQVILEQPVSLFFIALRPSFKDFVFR